MKPILILYATREGQTHRIADRIAARVRERGVAVDVVDAAQVAETIALDRYGAAILAASVHLGRHERELVSFVRHHLAALSQLPTAFLSVSLAAAGAEDPARAPEQRVLAGDNVRHALADFMHATGWRPTQVLAVAGALVYTKYNALVRFVMKMIARRSGATTDTSRDHEFTDWAALDRFAAAFVQELAPAASA